MMAAQTSFVHLHVHSYYSFFDSVLSPERIVELATALGCPSVALTDTNNFTGAVEFYQFALKRGLRPILGAEVTEPLPHERDIIHSRSLIKELSSSVENYSKFDNGKHSSVGSSSPMLMHGNPDCRAVLLACNFAGYSEISRLLTRRHLDSHFDLKQEFAGLSSNVIVLSDSPTVLTWAAELDRGQPYFWAMLMPSRHRRRRNRIIYDLARRHNLSLTVACDVKLATPSDAPLHNLLQAMRCLTTIENLPDNERLDPAHYFQPEETIRAFFHTDRGALPIHRELIQAIESTAVIANLCDCRLPLGEWKFPSFAGLTEEPAYVLRQQVEAGMRERYGSAPPVEALRRMNHELQVILELHFTEYFLLVHQIVVEARARGYHTIGRGSAANSIITYALGISNVCPLRYNLYFERFLNPERSAPPDIDLDFSWKERDDILDWCFEFFGQGRVALIATIQTLRSRQAIREVAKAHGLSEGEVAEFNRLHETDFCVEENTLQKTSPPRLHNLARDEPWRTVLELADRLTGFPHHLSVHCGGIVIAPGPVSDYVPLTTSAKGYAITQMDMVSVEDLGLIKMDLLGNRSLGVLKDAINMATGNTAGCERVDRTLNSLENFELSAQTVSIFQREAMRMKLAGTRRGTSVALAGVLNSFGGEREMVPRHHASVHECVFDFEFVTNDPATRALIDAGRTMGVFYIESPGMRALFERLRCRNFEEVVAASSIIRPGVAESGMMHEYIERHQRASLFEDLRSPTTILPASVASDRLANGLIPINAHAKTRVEDEYAITAKPGNSKRSKEVKIHPLMLELLPETHGVMVYQEDVLRVAHDLAGMSYAEADLLRRAMSGKMRSKEGMQRLRDRFFAGAQGKGFTEADTAEIWRQMASFSGYSFCKGHSAAFAVLSYQIAYLKAHHPAEFFAALLSNEGGFYGPAAYIEEVRRWGLTILPPCVNTSQDDYTGETEAVEVFQARGWVRVGLRAILGLSSQSRQSIIGTREREGRYHSLSDFLERSGVCHEECRILAKVGALHEISGGGSMPEMLIAIDGWMWQRAIAGGDTLFPNTTLPTQSHVMQLHNATATASRQRQCEWELLGFMVSDHPLDFARIPEDVIAARDIRLYRDQRIRMAGWMIAAKLLETRNGRGPMKMLTLEDRTDTFEAVLFPKIYHRLAARTLTRGPYLVEGKVDMSLGSPTLNVEQLRILEANPRG